MVNSRMVNKGMIKVQCNIGKPFYTEVVPTPAGLIRLLADEEYLYEADFMKEEDGYVKEGTGLRPEESLARGKNNVLDLARRELEAYFQGRLRSFSVPYCLGGTDFQKRVWREMAQIPFGNTISYGELAAKSGSPAACRAVGQVCHANPLAVFVPCHRVIGKNGSLVGFGGGLDKKAWLLNWEKKCLQESAR